MLMKKLYTAFISACFCIAGYSQQPSENCKPTFKEIFDFAVGDIFQDENISQSSAGGAGPTTTITRKYTVTNKTVNGDTMHYTIKGIKRIDYTCEGNRPYPEWCQQSSEVSEFTQSIVYIDSANHYLNRCDSAVIENFKPIGIHETLIMDTVYARLLSTHSKGADAKTIGGFGNTFIKDTKGELEQAAEFEYHETFAKGIGLTSAYHWFFEHTESKVLQAYVKNGDTVGNLKTDEELKYIACIDPSQICLDCGCYTLYEPVCGCDGKLYSNDCVARISGVTQFESMRDITISGNSTICKGAEVSLSVEGAASCLWFNGQQGNTLSFVPESSGKLWAQVTSHNGCQMKKEINITLTEPVTTSIDTLISLGDSVQIGDSYYTLPGTFRHRLSAANGCDSIVDLSVSLREFDTCVFQRFDTTFVTEKQTVTVYDTLTVTIEEKRNLTDTLFVLFVDSTRMLNTQQHSAQISIHPYPAGHEFTIESESATILSYTLTSSNGTLVDENRMLGTSKLTIDAGRFAAGIYFLTIQLEGWGEVNRKLIIE